MMLTLVRPSELREARWSEVVTQGGQWIIPTECMKTRVRHIVPLLPVMSAPPAGIPEADWLAAPAHRSGQRGGPAAADPLAQLGKRHRQGGELLAELFALQPQHMNLLLLQDQNRCTGRPGQPVRV